MLKNILVTLGVSFSVNLLQAADMQIRREGRVLGGIVVSRSDNKLNELLPGGKIEIPNLAIVSPTASEELDRYLSNQRALNLTDGLQPQMFMHERDMQGLEHAAAIGSILAMKIDEHACEIKSLKEQVELAKHSQLTCRKILMAICCCK